MGTKKVDVFIRRVKTLKSGEVNVSHELALEHDLQVGSKLTIVLDDGEISHDYIQRAVTVVAIKTLSSGTQVESCNVGFQKQGDNTLYTVEL